MFICIKDLTENYRKEHITSFLLDRDFSLKIKGKEEMRCLGIEKSL
jgi:hypothetical protein